MKWRGWYTTVCFVAAIIVGVALYETGTFNHMGRWGVILGLAFAPRFIFSVYSMWENRSDLKAQLDIATMSMSTIKAARREKKRKKLLAGEKKKWLK